MTSESSSSPRQIRQCLILSHDANYTVFLELVVGQYGFRAKVTENVNTLGTLSASMPTIAWIIDLDGIQEGIEDLVRLARQKAPDARLVFLSSRFTVEMAQACIQLGAIALLLKPFPVPRLVQALSSIHQEQELLEEGDLIPADDDDRDTPASLKDSGVDRPTAEVGSSVPVSPEPGSRVEDDPLLRTVSLVCPVCYHRFSSARFKLWIMPVCDTDTDFCPVTNGKVHPELYSAMVCPNCLFAYYAGLFSGLKVQENARREFLTPNLTQERNNLTSGLVYSGRRTLLHGIRSFDLGALSVRQLCIRNNVKLAGEFYLKSSWLCRKMGHALNERQSQEKALSCFETVYRPYLRQNGKFPNRNAIISRLEKLSDPLGERAIVITGFLAGETARRLGDRSKALHYLEETVNVPFLHQFTSLYQHIHAVYRKLKE